MPAYVTDDELRAVVDACDKAGKNWAAAARMLGKARSTIQSQYAIAARRGLLGTDPVVPTFAISSISTQRGPDGETQREWIKQRPEPGEEYEIPAGHVVKGESALVDAEGRILNRWIKTREGVDALDVVEAIKAAFDGYEPAAVAVDPPAAPDDNLLSLVPCNDWHINLLTWAKEVGQNWDLRIAEKVIGQGVEDAIMRSPQCDTAIVLGGGDLAHADNNENRTARSNNVLDVDGRHQKGLEVACRLMVRAIDAARRKARKVIVRILPGNHDPHTAAAVAYFLLAWYRNEPAVTVDVDASLFFWHRFGSVLIGATHGHTVKLKDMASIMAHRRAEDWGATKFRYVHGFHVHHHSKIATEGNGVIMESHQAPIPQDAWHFGSGFLSGRSMQVITYHRDYGEVARVRVAILDAEKPRIRIAAA